ncbi:MAG: hypothetical protein RI947_452 [Candidatus Parcubacteria bacterium]|jgi:uncharacterized membrane protein YeaQ/YmgE (transglycosylase-associated protein family)
MSILLWIILGFLAGWLASVIMKTDSQQGMLTDIILGIVGALVGGFIMNMFGAQGVSGLNIYSLMVATLGAVVLIWLGRVLRYG